MSLTIGVVKEPDEVERRVALVPDGVQRLRTAGLDVVVQRRAGAGSWCPDEQYAAAGAEIATRAEVIERADIVVSVGPPPDATFRSGQVLIGLHQPLTDPGFVRRCARSGVTDISFDFLPRTLSRAQGMDALSSQANVAGYKAAIVAAQTFGRFFPMLITAAGTAPPARVLVLGAGVAGLQAIGTARRLGASVAGYDVRPEARADIESLGATVLDISSPAAAAGTGGYARALTDAEMRAQQAELDKHLAAQDVIITTAQVPGRPPPRLVSADTVKAMRPGSVIVDLAAGRYGGNVELSEPDSTIVTENGVTVVGAGNLPSAMAPAASAAYSRNVCALVAHLVRDGALVIDLDDEILAATVITHAGEITQPAVAGASGGAEAAR